MGAAVSCVAEKFANFLCDEAIMVVSYMWNCSESVENLKDEVKNLKDKKDRLQKRMRHAKDTAHVPVAGLEEWIKNADAKISEAERFIGEEATDNNTSYNLSFFVNFGSLYRYGKEVKRQTSILQQHQRKGDDFERCVAHSPSTPGFADICQRVDLKYINTQKLALKEIIQAIKDHKIVGIHGLGGVGKTTLAREAAAEMNNQFDYIQFITISQPFDAKRIKEEVQQAATRISNGDKVLIILDDMWKEFKLDEVNIPCGIENKNFKILLTSRSRAVCVKMNALIISVKPLEHREALALFESVVGEREWDVKSQQVAHDIVEECGGLPLFVQHVGNALKDKEIKIWESALRRLKAPIDGDATYKKKGLLQLKLSYDYLENEVAESCFLLCSMFPEDGITGLKRLAYYGLGLGIFKNPDCEIQEAKDKVQHAVDLLKSSFLLQPAKRFKFFRTYDDDEEEEFKMHDLVREMALFITFMDNNQFLVQSGEGLREWQPKEHMKIYKKISLMGNKICELPDHKLIFRHLDTFLIQDNELSVIPDEFFQGMKKVKVLDMSNNKISSLPPSLTQLKELRMLDLSGNNSLCEIYILGGLTCLEILKLQRTGIKDIPKEIGHLTNLRLLDVDYCTFLFSVAPGVISKLTSLEELSVELKMVKTVENHNVGQLEGDSCFLVELNKMKKLKILNLKVPELCHIPEDFHFETLEEFYIKDNIDWLSKKHGCKRILQIAKTSFPFTIPIMKLIQVSEVLELFFIKCLDNILPVICPEGLCDNVTSLKYINLMGCDNITSLVKTSDRSNDLGQRKTKGKFYSQVKGIWLYHLDRLKLLWDSPHQFISFCNLADIEITNCSSLEKLFPLSVAQELVKLKELTISNCESLEVVISAGDEQTTEDKTVMLHLTSITLCELPRLESFYSGHSTIKYPCSFECMYVEDCPSMKTWSNGDNHMPNIKFKYERKLYSNINKYIAAQVEKNGVLSMWDWCQDDTEDEIVEE